MKSLTQNLRQWRVDRNIIKADTKVYVENVIEELLEIFYTNKKDIVYFQNEIMDKYFDKKPVDELNTIDAIQDIQVFSINENELLGYCNEKCNDEVFKHINARKQDPSQKPEWEEEGVSGKWIKDKFQNKDEIYEPDYMKAIRGVNCEL